MERGWLRLILKAIDMLSLVGALIGGAFALLTALMVSYEVFSRAVFNAPTAFATEFSTYLLLGIAFLGAAYGVRESGHVQMDVLVNQLSKKWRLLLDAFASLLALAFACVFAWQGWGLAIDSYQSSSLSPTVLQVPLFLPQLMLPIGGALLVLQLVARIVRDLAGVLSPETEATPSDESSRIPEEVQPREGERP